MKSSNAPITSDLDRARKEFFRRPVSYSRLPKSSKKSGERSTLYLLRRDLQHLYLHEERDYPGKRKVPSMLATCGALIGIDLMSKFHSPNETKNGTRFLKFLKDVSALQEWQSQFLWDLRNALMHSYSFTIDRGPNEGKFIRFSSAVSPTQEWVRKWKSSDGKEGFDFHFWEFKDVFRAVIRDYEKRLIANPAEQKAFLKSYKEFGYLRAKTTGI